MNPISNYELIKLHDESTMLCSFPGHMRDCSGTYKQIIEKGNEIIPNILAYLKNEKSGGMSIILLLEDITHESPYEPKPIGDTGFVSYKVSDTIKAWLNWGKRKGYIYE